MQHFVHARAGQYEAASRERRRRGSSLQAGRRLAAASSALTYPKTAVLVDWWHKAVIIGVLVACFILVVGAIGWMLYRELAAARMPRSAPARTKSVIASLPTIRPI